MRGLRNPIITFAAVAALVALAPPTTASAAKPKVQPITCEMVVQQDANLYLARDLTCRTFAVRVVQYQGEPEPGPVPHVTVDLRGHTLRGDGTGSGITAFSFPGYPELDVRNGRLENFAVAVGSDGLVGIRNVHLVGNRVGFSCNGYCRVERSLVKGSSQTGFTVGADASGVVRNTVFQRNATGVWVGWVSGLEITRSAFAHNGIGVAVQDGATASVSTSLFLRNRVGVQVTLSNPDDGLCVTLSRDSFVRNGTNLVGPRC